MRKFFNKASKTVILKKGRYVYFMRRGGWEYVTRCNCTGIVIILAMTDDRKVILTSQYRVPVGSEVIEFPAGLINDRRSKRREGVLAAARRELLEETGYLAHKITRVMEGPAGSGLSADILTIVRAFGLKKIHQGGGDKTENITVFEVPLTLAEQWLVRKQREGYLVDPKIYAGLYFLGNYNKKNFKKSQRSHPIQRRKN